MTMYSLYYFLHLAGIAIWVGSFIAFGYLLRSIVKNEHMKEHLPFITDRIRRWVNWGVLPGAGIVLITGVMMIVEFDHATIPFYFIFMERMGGFVTLATIIALSLYSRKLRKKIEGKPMKKDRSLVSLNRAYSTLLFTSAFLVTVVIVVVSMRIM